MIIFTDLDGSLLDREDYSYKDAEPALELLKVKGIPLIFCSSKTLLEQEVLRKEMGLDHPFIVEDGGATFIGKDYFRSQYSYQRILNSYHVIEYGMPYKEIRRVLKLVAHETRLKLTGYGDMSVDEVAAKTGLTREAAERARRRQYQETIVSDLSAEGLKCLNEALARYGLTLSRGTRFFGVMGSNDKGEAAAVLIDLYRRECGQILTVGFGDSKNDASLFSVVDQSFLVQKPDATWEDIDNPNLIRVGGVGPVGWNRGIIKMLS